MSHRLHELARARGVADPVLPLYGPPDNGMAVIQATGR